MQIDSYVCKILRNVSRQNIKCVTSLEFSLEFSLCVWLAFSLVTRAIPSLARRVGSVALLTDLADAERWRRIDCLRTTNQMAMMAMANTRVIQGEAVVIYIAPPMHQTTYIGPTRDQHHPWSSRSWGSHWLGVFDRKKVPLSTRKQRDIVVMASTPLFLPPR